MRDPLQQTTFDTPGAGPEATGAAGRELMLTVLHHPDLRRVGDVARWPARPGASWALCRNTPVFDGGAGEAGPLADPGVSRAPLEIGLSAEGLALRPSRADLRVRVDGREIGLGSAVAFAQVDRGFRLSLNERVVLWVQRVAERSAVGAGMGLIGVSPALDALRLTIHDLAPSEAPVLLLGQTGVGKERVARALHEASPRRNKPFVAVNLAAVPAETAVSQLFGHARGAFTGASEPHEGWFGQAHGGTLFLDEIGDLPLALQPALLRALESGEVQPVGGRARKVDVRVISATDVDLAHHIAERRFRASLYFRLAQRVIRVPDLLERPADVAVLWVHFVREALVRLGAEARVASTGATPWMPIGVIEALYAHDWPGNVRELRAEAEAYAELNARREVAAIPVFRAAEARSEAASAGSPALDLLDALEANDWAILPTARALGVGRNTLRRQMEERGLRRAIDVELVEVHAALAEAGGDLDAAARALRVSARGLKLRLG